MSPTPKQKRKKDKNSDVEVNSLKCCDFIFKDVKIIQWEKIH